MSDKNAAARYRELIASRAEIVDLTLPSGFVFKFRKPNTIGIILSGELPQSAANEAVEAWEQSGAVETVEATEDLQVKVAQKAFEIRDRAIELSHSPKIVIGRADPDKDEVSTDEISDADLTYIFKWVSAGGDASVMLAMFPQGREQSVMDSAGRKKLRNARKRLGRDK